MANPKCCQGAWKATGDYKSCACIAKSSANTARGLWADFIRAWPLYLGSLFLTALVAAVIA